MVIKTVITINTKTGERKVEQCYIDKRLDYSGLAKTIAERMMEDAENQREM